jgi:hypothetical protein
MVLRFKRFGAACAVLVVTCLLASAPAQATHPRPKSASPLQMSLVPAYAPCVAPNRTHGPPLAFPSCNPPAQTSAHATVGTPDAFGGAASSAGFLRLKYLPCRAGNCHEDEEDIGIDIALNDVRCVPTGAPCGTANASGPGDYSGQLRFSYTVRLTDHYNPMTWPEAPVAATVQDIAIEHSWACVQSGSTSTGSACSLHTSLNALIPAASKGKKRTIWELDAVRIYDGGADGDGDTTADNTVFARPGIFIP